MSSYMCAVNHTAASRKKDQTSELEPCSSCVCVCSLFAVLQKMTSCLDSWTVSSYLQIWMDGVEDMMVLVCRGSVLISVCRNNTEPGGATECIDRTLKTRNMLNQTIGLIVLISEYSCPCNREHCRVKRRAENHWTTEETRSSRLQKVLAFVTRSSNYTICTHEVIPNIYTYFTRVLSLVVSWKTSKVCVKILARNVDQTTDRWQQRPRVQPKEVTLRSCLLDAHLHILYVRQTRFHPTRWRHVTTQTTTKSYDVNTIFAFAPLLYYISHFHWTDVPQNLSWSASSVVSFILCDISFLKTPMYDTNSCVAHELYYKVWQNTKIHKIINNTSLQKRFT